MPDRGAAIKRPEGRAVGLPSPKRSASADPLGFDFDAGAARAASVVVGLTVDPAHGITQSRTVAIGHTPTVAAEVPFVAVSVVLTRLRSARALRLSTADGEIGWPAGADPDAHLEVGRALAAGAVLLVVPVEAVFDVVAPVVEQQTLAGLTLELVVEALFGGAVANGHLVAPVFAIPGEVTLPVRGDAPAVGAAEGVVGADEDLGDAAAAAVVHEGLVALGTGCGEVEAPTLRRVFANVADAGVVGILAIELTLAAGDGAPLGHLDARVGVVTKGRTDDVGRGALGPTVVLVLAGRAIEVLVAEILPVDALAVATAVLVLGAPNGGIGDAAAAAVVVEALRWHRTVEVDEGALVWVFADVLDPG